MQLATSICLPRKFRQHRLASRQQRTASPHSQFSDEIGETVVALSGHLPSCQISITTSIGVEIDYVMADVRDRSTSILGIDLVLNVCKA